MPSVPALHDSTLSVVVAPGLRVFNSPVDRHVASPLQSATATGTAVSLTIGSAPKSPGGGSKKQGPPTTAPATQPPTTRIEAVTRAMRSRRRRRWARCVRLHHWCPGGGGAGTGPVASRAGVTTPPAAWASRGEGSTPCSIDVPSRGTLTHVRADRLSRTQPVRHLAVRRDAPGARRGKAQDQDQ